MAKFLSPAVTPSRHLYQVMVDERDEVIVELNRRGVFPGVHYRDNTSYAMYASAAGSCPRAARASARLISLPLHLRMGKPEVERVSAALRAAVGRPGGAASE